MTTQKAFLISELHRYKKEHGKIPMGLDLTIKSGYPTVFDFIHAFGSLKQALVEASMNKELPKIYNNKCSICKCSFTTEIKHRYICKKKECRYISDKLLQVEQQKKKYKHSIFHFLSNDELIEYFRYLYSVKKENLNTIKVI